MSIIGQGNTAKPNKRGIKMKIQQMTSPRTGNAVPNQFLITIGDCVYFQSYQTVIAKKNENTRKVTLCEDWNYSRTTLKYLNKFLGDTKADIKKRIEEGKYKIVETIELGS